MESFSDHLRKQREDRKIRLSDVAVQTRISVKFLEALEGGNFEILPETYIRAFIRDYAKAVGLDPDDTIKRFDLYVESLKVEKEQKEAEAGEKGGSKPLNLTGIQKIGLGAAGIIILAVLSYLAFSPNKKEPVTPEEYGYDNSQVVNERRFDSAYSAATKPVAKADSSKLELQAVDTVWVNLVIDEGKTYDLLMKPGAKLAFWGRRKFNMTIGNAGGLVVSLNGHEFPPLGKPGVVIRNVTILKDGTIKK
jgi:cytoskeleton protein RodZ